MSRRTASGTLVATSDLFPPPEERARAVDPIHMMVGGYRIERVIGQGGMGAVYLAVHPILRTQAAVKVLHHEISSRADLAKRFISEARVVATLRHPHIVQIFDFVTLPDGRLAIVMEYLDGATLEDRAGPAPMSPGRARSILLQLCSALATAHHQGVVHRDLKAQNIVMVNAGAQDYVKLLDFGLVKLETQEAGLTTPGMVLGTPHYMAPEQVVGDAVDRRADVYALGVLLFRLMTGAVPFEGTPSQVMFHHLQTPPPDPMNTSPELRKVVLKAMAKRREDRFQDVVELARALRACPLDPAKKPVVSKPQLFTARVEGMTVFLRFVSESAFHQIEQYDLSRGRLFIPGAAPKLPGLLHLVAEVPGREPVEAPATLLGLFDQRTAEKHGISEGFVVTLRGRFGPGTGTRASRSSLLPPSHPRQRRHALRLPATFGLPGAVSLTGVTTNLSARGVGLTTPTLLPVGSMLSMSIELSPGRRAHLQGSVVWSRETAQGQWKGMLGVRLTQVDDSYQQFTTALSQGAPLEAASGLPAMPESVDVDLAGGPSDESTASTEKIWLRERRK